MEIYACVGRFVFCMKRIVLQVFLCCLEGFLWKLVVVCGCLTAAFCFLKLSFPEIRYRFVRNHSLWKGKPLTQGYHAIEMEWRTVEKRWDMVDPFQQDWETQGKGDHLLVSPDQEGQWDPRRTRWKKKEKRWKEALGKRATRSHQQGAFGKKRGSNQQQGLFEKKRGRKINWIQGPCG